MSLSGNTEKITELISKINALPESEEPSYQAKTVSPSTSSQTVKPDSGYDALSQVTVNAMPTATQATPSITVSSAGLITAKATQTAGYVAAGTKSATKQLTVQAAQTITPGTSNKTIASGRYLTGTQTIKGDANLVAGNIKSGVSIFGVAGSYEGSGGGSGGGVETCTVTIKIGGIPSPEVGIGTVYFVQADGSRAEININLLSSAATIEVLQNSIVALNVSFEGLLTTNCELLFSKATYEWTKACAIYIGAVDSATIKIS